MLRIQELKSLYFIIICLLFTNLTFSDSKKNNSEIIQKKLENIEQKITSIKKEKDSILNQIYGIELKYEKELLKKNKLQSEIKKLSIQIKQKSIEKELLNTKIEQSKKKITKILRVLYKQGSHKHLRVFLNTKNINRLFKNYKFFESLISYNNKEIVNFRNDIKRLLKIREELSKKNEIKQKSKIEVDKKILNLKYIKKNKLSLIKKINNDKEKYIKLRSELEKEFLKFNDSVIKKIRKTVEISQKEIDLMKGKLIWPVNGDIITSFGKQKSTKFNTYVMNTGIEIKPINNQTKAKAIYAGNVVFADYWKGYGKLIVIQHSNRFLSFYGHCEKFLKKKKDIVSMGEAIAIIGDTGSANIRSLYFEIRKNSVAENPLKWLEKR